MTPYATDSSKGRSRLRAWAAPDPAARSSAHSFGWIRPSASRAFLTASLVAALRLGSSVAFGQIVESPIAEDPVVLDSSVVSGKVLPSGVKAYFGVPYAAAPVGDLRWREPQPV
jgi:hypothetical protein